MFQKRAENVIDTKLDRLKKQNFKKYEVESITV